MFWSHFSFSRFAEGVSMSLRLGSGISRDSSWNTPAAVIPCLPRSCRLCVRTSLTRTSDPRYDDFCPRLGAQWFLDVDRADDHGGAWGGEGAEGEELGMSIAIPFLG